MTDGETLLVVLALVYLSDCVAWIGHRSALFAAPWRRRWRVFHAGAIFGNSRGGLALLNPLPPLGAAFLGRWLPVSLSPAGVCDGHLHGPDRAPRPPHSGRSLAWGAIAGADAQGADLLVNGAPFARCESGAQAEFLADAVRRAAREPERRRERFLREFVAARFARDDAAARLADADRLARPLRRSALALFAFLFAAAPVLATALGLTSVLLPAAAVLLLGAWLIAFQFFRAHRALHPAAAGERIAHLAMMALCPPLAIRAHDLLTLDALARFHPVVLARLLPGPDASTLVRSIVRDVHHPLAHGLADPPAAAIAAWHAAAERDACLAFLRAEWPSPVEEFLAPPHWDGVSNRYCPRCSCQLTTEAPECPDCPGVTLIPIAKRPDASEDSPISA